MSGGPDASAPGDGSTPPDEPSASGSALTDDREPSEDDPIDPESVDRDAVARGGLYSLLARGFRHPDESLHAAAADGRLAGDAAELAETTIVDLPAPDGAGESTQLVTDDDFETLCARYNDLFVIGFATYEDRTDGSLASDGPPVPLYESTYRPEASWGDVNLDLARAYEFFGLGVDGDDRDNHDALPLQLEFAAYLARREALGEPGAAAARLDLLDRHLSYVAAGVCERLLEEVGTDIYGDLGDLLARLIQAEQADLGQRRQAGEFELEPTPSDGGGGGEGKPGDTCGGDDGRRGGGDSG